MKTTMLRCAVAGVTMMAAWGLGTTACSTDAGSTADGGTKDSGGGPGTANDAGGGPGTANDAGGGSDAGSGDSGTTPTCAAYCAKIDTNCTGGNKQYLSTADCLKECPSLPVGAAADQSGNTLGCRTYHAGAAASDPVTHCRHAGPYGGGLCGTDRCASFCQIAQGLCPPTGTPAGYATEAACATACAGFTFQADAGEAASAPTAGNTLNCRGYHLQAAASTPNPHCGHIMAGGPCQ